MQPETAAAVEQVIRRRRTEKVMCPLGDAAAVPPEVAERNRVKVLDSIRAAGWAPFHYPRGVAGIAEPWRALFLGDESARKLARFLRDELNATTKEPDLAAGCSAMVIVTWLPEATDPTAQDASPAASEKTAARIAGRNEEHLAAASAMVQNLLLMLTAHGMGTYWSSGGRLRDPATFDYLGVGRDERLLAAVFVEYPEMRAAGAKERRPGKQRDNRGDAWLREAEL